MTDDRIPGVARTARTGTTAAHTTAWNSRIWMASANQPAVEALIFKRYARREQSSIVAVFTRLGDVVAADGAVSAAGEVEAGLNCVVTGRRIRGVEIANTNGRHVGAVLLQLIGSGRAPALSVAVCPDHWNASRADNLDRVNSTQIEAVAR